MLVAKAVASGEISLIWFPLILEVHSVYDRNSIIFQVMTHFNDVSEVLIAMAVARGAMLLPMRLLQSLQSQTFLAHH